MTAAAAAAARVAGAGAVTRASPKAVWCSNETATQTGIGGRIVVRPKSGGVDGQAGPRNAAGQADDDAMLQAAAKTCK